MRLPNLLHECIYSLLKRPAVQRASKVITSHILLACTFLVVLWKRVAVTFVEVSLVLGFCCWLTPITLTVLCVSTCSDGLLDFHRVAGEEGGQGSSGDPPTVGLILVQQPRGEDEKEARCGEHQLSEVLGIDAEL